jgi:hypothetical protein
VFVLLASGLSRKEMLKCAALKLCQRGIAAAGVPLGACRGSKIVKYGSFVVMNFVGGVARVTADHTHTPTHTRARARYQRPKFVHLSQNKVMFMDGQQTKNATICFIPLRISFWCSDTAE